MTTSRTTHPEDLLEAFALDALEPEEEESVLEHLEQCLQCSGLVADYLRTTTALAYLAPAAEPPEHLRIGLMAAIEPPAIEVPQEAATDTALPTRRQPRSWSGIYRGIGSRWGRLLMPVTAGAAVVVAAFLIAINVQITGERDDMMVKNSELQESLDESRATATTQLALASEAISQMQGDLQFLQSTLAQPGTQSLIMDPMQPNSDAWGVLALSGDGTMAVIMASDLEPLTEGLAYHVWVMDGGKRSWAGDMIVDEHGWGAVALDMSTSTSAFETVQVSRAPLTLGAAGIVGDIVLEVSLP